MRILIGLFSRLVGIGRVMRGNEVPAYVPARSGRFKPRFGRGV